MKRWIILTIIIAGIGVAGWWGYSQVQAQQQAAEVAAQAAAAAQTADLEQVIWASGKLQPATWAGLSPAGSGSVATIYVAQGDTVQAGDLLLELDNAVLQSQVTVAAAALTEATAALAKLEAGATPAEIAAAEATVAAAQAQVEIAAGQLQDVQSAVKAADARVATTQAQYAEVASHPTPAEQLAARAAIAQAQAGVTTAQAAYNRVKDDPEVGALPESLALNQATAALEAAQAQADVKAQAATPEQLAVAAAAIREAQTAAEAARQQSAGAEANVRAALAQVASAQAALDRLRAGATVEDIAMAQARVQSAQAAVASARAQLGLTQLRAPFAGQVGAVNVRPGELIAPGAYALLLGDTGRMHVETTDLRETDVVRVQVGMPVEVTFDAAPNRIFQGTVTQVAPVSSAEKGSTNYTVNVDVRDLDPALRWGMTAFVNIRPQS